MEKLDLAKKHKEYFTASTKPQIIEFYEAQYLSILGKGDPSSSEFSNDIQALYTTAYAVKFLAKASGNDFVVSKLEGLWWFDEEKYKSFTISDAPQKIPRSEWEYRLLIRLPDFVSADMIEKAKQTALEKKGISKANEIALFKLKEGKCVQMMHVGSFASEPETLLIMDKFMKEKGFHKNGLHHEIYLSDFRKVSEDKLKTILREPVK